MLTTSTSGPETPLPQYRCHKVVRAIKIARIVLHKDVDPPGAGGQGPYYNVDTAFLYPDESHGLPGRVVVGRPYLVKYEPQIGGYYVVYADGYESYSPADAFEDGYTKIELLKKFNEGMASGDGASA